jgi:hypothetical protein
MNIPMALVFISAIWGLVAIISIVMDRKKDE